MTGRVPTGAPASGPTALSVLAPGTPRSRSPFRPRIPTLAVLSRCARGDRSVRLREESPCGLLRNPVKVAAMIYWFTGQPGAGKTTLALALKSALHKRGHPVVHLD